MNKKAFTIVVVLLSYGFWAKQQIMSQVIVKDNCELKKRVYNVNCEEVKSFCDSIIVYSIAYFDTPIWFKMSISGDLNELSILCTTVQYFDSSYVHDNQQWINGSSFDLSPFSYGIFYHKEYLFEFYLDLSMDNATIETLFSKTDSTAVFCPWNKHAKPKFLTRKIKFPHFCQLCGKIYQNGSKIVIEKRNSTFDVKKKIKKRTKSK